MTIFVVVGWWLLVGGCWLVVVGSHHFDVARKLTTLIFQPDMGDGERLPISGRR